MAVRVFHLLASVAPFLSAAALAQVQPKTAQDWLDNGTAAYRSGDYGEAVRDFRQAVGVDPANVSAHLDLGQAFETQFIPGAASKENLQYADDAQTEFEKALTLDPYNVLATSSIAALYYNRKDLDKAEEWNKRVIALDAGNKEAYYTLAVLAWTRWLPVDRQARVDSNQDTVEPGPIANAELRAGLKAKWLAVLDEGVFDLEKALRIDPRYDDAMAYMNLLIRYRADLLDTRDEYVAAAAQADDWMLRALELRKSKGVRDPVLAVQALPPPPPPPPPGAAPSAIRVGAEVQAANLLKSVEPEYPPLARQARISGKVAFRVTIGDDGHVKGVQLVSGHPLLVEAARDAVRQYVYKPTLLNGQPVDVITRVEVAFELR